MGMIGRWIDARTDAERDRIIEHPDPTYNGEHWWDFGRDCGCLVGAVKGREQHFPDDYEPVAGRAKWIDVMSWEESHDEVVGNRFVDLVKCLGPERAWRIVKARAARKNRVEIPTAPVLEECETAQ